MCSMWIGKSLNFSLICAGHLSISTFMVLSACHSHTCHHIRVFICNVLLAFNRKVAINHLLTYLLTSIHKPGHTCKHCTPTYTPTHARPRQTHAHTHTHARPRQTHVHTYSSGLGLSSKDLTRESLYATRYTLHQHHIGY